MHVWSTDSIRASSVRCQCTFCISIDCFLSSLNTLCIDANNTSVLSFNCLWFCSLAAFSSYSDWKNKQNTLKCIGVHNKLTIKQLPASDIKQSILLYNHYHYETKYISYKKVWGKNTGIIKQYSRFQAVWILCCIRHEFVRHFAAEVD